MLRSLTLLCTLSLGSAFGIAQEGGAPAVESVCQQVAPVPPNGEWMRSPNQSQAIVLIHGYQYHLLDKYVPRAELRPWQRADSTLVKQLARTADVYVFAYGQNVALQTIVEHSNLPDSVARLSKLGYKDITLVGHSAGGLIARHFVEDCPNAGVTRVFQLCSPNGGSPLANLQGARSQRAFMDCLTEKGRKECLMVRADKSIPRHVQFLCVVGKGDGKSDGDGVVSCVCQWSADLQQQGIPAVALPVGHREIVRDEKTAEALATLVRGNHTRWTMEQTAEARRVILGK
jgi:hypothetical protein